MVESNPLHPQRDAILATKVRIPRVRSGFLHRPRLIRRLDEAVHANLMVVCTPAGFGKTTLLAGWARSARVPVAWVSLDEADNDPARFWRYVAAALGRARGHGGVERHAALEALAGASSEGMAAAVARALEQFATDLVLVLDDYHLIRTPDVHQGMRFLLDHQPPGLHVVVASRTDPPLPLARLRGRGHMSELRAKDLRFTRDEATALLGQTWQLQISAEAVGALVERTEGWAVGLQLAALSLRDRADHDGFIAAFTGTHRFVLDYLSEEVFESQPRRMQAFLLGVSILDRMCAPLCQAVTGDHDSQPMLEALDRANLFVVPLDDERRWYRFHHLFADVLRARLQQVDGTRVPELHRRAADWLAEHDRIDDAIPHALAAGDPGSAADLVEGALNDTLARGEGATVARWLSQLPDDVVRGRPRLGITRAMLAWRWYRLEEMERALAPIEQAVENRPGGLQVPTEGGMVGDVNAAISLLRGQLVLVGGDTTTGRRHVNAALARLTDAETGPRFWAGWLLLICDWIEGRMEQAETGLAEMLAEGRASSSPHPLMTSVTSLGLVQEARGRLGAALRTYEDALRFARAGERRSPFHEGEAHLGIARALYQRNQLAAALQHATEGVELERAVVEPVLLNVGLHTLAWIRQAMGDPDAALAAMDESIGLIPTPGVVGWFYAGHAGRARLLLVQGRREEARRWLSHAPGPDEVSYAHERDHLTLAHLLLADGDAGRAAALLEQLDALATADGRLGSAIEIRALLAVAREAGDDHDAALALLAETIGLARPEGHVRAFVDHGDRMGGLLRRLASSAPERTRGMPRADRVHLNRVLRAFTCDDDSREDASAQLMAPLTDREFEVLRLVAAGRRNNEIASELWVSIDTVKKHLTHILDKLAVRSRTEAVAAARELGLLRN